MIMRLIPIIVLFIAVWPLSADELQLKTKTVHQGVFLSLDHKGRVTFQTFEQDEPLNFPLSVISAIRFDKPQKASFVSRRNKKKSLDALFYGLQDGKFSLKLAKESAAKDFQQLQIHKLTAILDMRDFMLRRQTYQQQKAAATEKQGVRAEEMLVAGKATVLHFVVAEVDVASRQGNLARKLCNDNEHKAAYVEVVLNSLQHQTAVVNGLKSLPQFWFYTANGELFDKLVNRFTEDDIEKTLQKTLEGKF